MISDTRAALLSFRRDPRFVAAIVATLALGIAPNCVIFAIMDGIYFRPLPYPRQESLVLLNVSRPSKAALEPLDAYTFAEWQRGSAFETAAAYRNAFFALNSGDRPERIAGQSVTPDFFRTLGMQPARGRGFRPADAAPGAPRALVVSHRVWKEYFGGRTDIVGLTVRLDGTPATVVGVTPPRFVSFMEGRPAQMWVPMPLSSAAAPAETAIGNAVARLKPGVPLEAARAGLQTAHAALSRQFQDFYRDRTASVRDFRSSLFGGLGPGIRMLGVMVGLLLLIACGNAANLLLGRAVRRTREVAVRTALGARRWQLVRGLVAESLLLALAAALLGLGLAYAAVKLVWAGTAPIFRDIGVESLAVDGRVAGFAVVLAVLVALLFGVLPALRASRVDLVGALKEGSPGAGRGGRRGRMSRALVVGQVALCVLTMICAALVLRTVVHFAGVAANPGFQPRGLLVAGLPQPGEAARPGARVAALQDVERRVAALPSVQRAALADRLPFLDGGARVRAALPAAGGAGEGPAFDADLRVVDEDFFPVMSMPLVRGRLFASTDDANGPPVTVVSDRFASAHWKGGDPIGARLLVRGTWRTVVGVVRSAVQPTPFRPAARELFLPYAQAEPRDVKLLVQCEGPADKVAAGVRKAVAAVDRDQPIVGLQAMEEALDRFMTPFRLILGLTLAFSAIALALAAVGLYAVIAHGVSRRRREMGVRMALGARRGEVVRLVVGEGVRLAAIGLAVGLLPGLALAKVLPAAILGVGGLPVLHYVAAMLLWLAVALAASLVPARRAARLDPMSALRCE